MGFVENYGHSVMAKRKNAPYGWVRGYSYLLLLNLTAIVCVKVIWFDFLKFYVIGKTKLIYLA